MSKGLGLLEMLDSYAKEKGFGPRIIHCEHGFATYHLNSESCYIEDIYVVPEQRKSGVAKEMADKITEIAKECGLKTLIGSVNIKANGKDSSMRVLLAYGMTLAETNGDMIYLTKEI